MKDTDLISERHKILSPFFDEKSRKLLTAYRYNYETALLRTLFGIITCLKDFFYLLKMLQK